MIGMTAIHAALKESIAALFLGAFVAACTSTERRPETVATTDTAAITAVSPDDPDREFLRRLAEHHAGIMFTAHSAHQNQDSVSVRGGAMALDEHHHAEADTALALLRRRYGDEYVPVVTERHAIMVDSLQRTTGAEYDRRYRRFVAEHHRETAQLIDGFLPRLRLPEVVALARNLRTKQTAELDSLVQPGPTQ